MEQCRNEPSLLRRKSNGLAYGKDESRPRYATPTGLHPPARGCRTRLPWVDQCRGEPSLFRRNPNGVASSSPGLPYSATLGDGAAAEAELVVAGNPEGVAAYGSRHTAPPRFALVLCAKGATPLGFGTLYNPASQGSRVQQSWALRCNPVGIGLKRPNSRGQTEDLCYSSGQALQVHCDSRA